MVLQRSIDMMYQGQWRSLQVPVVSPFTSVPDAVAAFHADHDREHAFRRDDTPVELFRLSVTAIGTVPKAELMSHAANGAQGGGGIPPGWSISTRLRAQSRPRYTRTKGSRRV